MRDVNWKNIAIGVAIVAALFGAFKGGQHVWQDHTCLLYTSDAADE